MFERDNWQEIFNSIAKHKLRTFLTALGVFWGIFMLIFLLGTGKGMENGVMNMFGGMVTNSIYVWPQSTTLPYKGFQPGRSAQFTIDDVNAVKTTFQDINHVAPRLNVNAGKIVYGKKEGSFEVRGELPEAFYILPIEILNGRFINEIDLSEKRKVIVIGKRVKEVLFEDIEPVGKYLRINGTEYQIVGTYKSKLKGDDGAEEEQTIFMPLSTAQQVTNSHNRVNWFVCSAKDAVDAGALELKIRALLRERHSIHPEDINAISSYNMGEEFQEFQNLFIAINGFVGFIGIMTLIFGIVGVSNIMLIVVKERTKEIGVRKALGATPRSIITMILMESIFLTTFAGYFGLLAGTGLISIINATGFEHDFFANPEVSVGVCLTALTVLIIAGSIAGLIPALQAARVNPVVALKDE